MWQQTTKPMDHDQVLQCIIIVIMTTKQLAQNHWTPGGRLNKKDGLTRYGDSHVKDKTS